MILGIDAANTRTGGTLTHLSELLRVAEPMAHGFSQVIVWGGQRTLSRIEDRPWLLKSPQSLLDKSLAHRTYWQCYKLDGLVRQVGCDLLFVPGGPYAGDFYPIVAMSQNMLPFEWQELRRWGWSLFFLKLMLLRWTQSRTFRRAAGLIFLTRYAHDVVTYEIKTITGRTTIIPHGIDERFVCPPREQLAIDRYSAGRPFRVLYVSTIDMYKHQWKAAEAVAQLRASGVPVMLNLVGPAYPPALARLKQTIAQVDPSYEFIQYAGPVAHSELPARYAQADLCLFASSCENMPVILLESMASGLPIACSNRGPMPEMLGDAGIYFDPEDAADMARALRELIESPELRARLANASYKRVQLYSWPRCANETFRFLASIANNR